jgi:hypothetical protein
MRAAGPSGGKPNSYDQPPVGREASIWAFHRLRICFLRAGNPDFPWLSCYRRLNTIFDRMKDHLIALVQIVFVSILSRRLKRLAVGKVSA